MPLNLASYCYSMQRHSGVLFYPPSTQSIIPYWVSFYFRGGNKRDVCIPRNLFAYP